MQKVWTAVAAVAAGLAAVAAVVAGVMHIRNRCID